jgi:hypothetical protein
MSSDYHALSRLAGWHRYNGMAMNAMGRRSHVAETELLRRDRDRQACQTGNRKLQAVGDVLEGGAPSKIGRVWQRGVVLSQGQLAVDSEHAPGEFKAMASQACPHICARMAASPGATTGPDAGRRQRAGLPCSGRKA